MDRRVVAAVLTTIFFGGQLHAFQAPEGRNLGKVTGGDFKKAHTVIEKKCTLCHGQERIDAALKAGKDMGVIQREMEKKGARLNSNEREVLGIYWKQNPLKK